MQYAFASVSCKGTYIGKGTAQKIASTAKALAALKAAANVPVAGLWNGVYTSTNSPNPTKETIFLANFGAVTKGIYVSDSGAAGILTGRAPSNPFILSDNAPSPPCPGRGVFEGDVQGNTMAYEFHSVDCEGKFDIGHGKAERGL